MQAKLSLKKTTVKTAMNLVSHIFFNKMNRLTGVVLLICVMACPFVVITAQAADVVKAHYIKAAAPHPEDKRTEVAVKKMASFDPAAADYTGNKGTKIYVSKLGDSSDGHSWKKAFHTIQAALLAVPDDKGGHQIIIRPDTYMEPYLAPMHAGAAGSYNLIMGDFDGKLGSGATGWVILDCSDQEKKGCLCVDWGGDGNTPSFCGDAAKSAFF